MEQRVAELQRDPLCTCGALRPEPLAQRVLQEGHLARRCHEKPSVQQVPSGSLGGLHTNVLQIDGRVPPHLGVVQDVTLEAIQDGARLAVDGGEQPLPVRAVPSALRAAIARALLNDPELLYSTDRGSTWTTITGCTGNYGY